MSIQPSESKDHCDTLVVGGGLSGLVTAWRLRHYGLDFRLLEARGMLGGRILSHPFTDRQAAESAAVDLGPSWFWPGQHALLDLLRELDLQDYIFEQPSSGKSVLEYGNGQIEHSAGGASMAGAYRLKGGIGSLIHRLEKLLDPATITLNSPVQTITATDDGFRVSTTVDDATQTLSCNNLVITLPPRLAAETIDFTPALGNKERRVLENAPTWMAAQAKIVATYDSAFWLDQGLSGDAFSQVGPMVEIHDASDSIEHPALFGFVGVPATARVGLENELKSAAQEQLVRLFGSEAGQTRSLHLQDWASETYTAAKMDITSMPSHVQTAPDASSHWHPAMLWSGSETAATGAHSNGFLEGAVESGLRSVALIRQRSQNSF